MRYKGHLLSRISAGNDKKSLRVYLPDEVTKKLELKPGDFVEWVDEGKGKVAIKNAKLAVG